MAREPFNDIWANNPSMDQFEEPPTSTFETGWEGGADKNPPQAKWENWWHNRVDVGLQQIERFGVMDYDDAAIYGIGGRARGTDGKFYVSVSTPNEGNDPTADGGTNWELDAGAGNNIIVFDSPGTTSWAVPGILSSGVRLAHVTVIGGGGGGGNDTTSGGSGGAQGGVSEGIVDLTGETSVSVTVGASGTVSGNSSGTPGGDSSFGTFMSATGGSGGAQAGNVPSLGGTGSGGNINYQGQWGSRASVAASGGNLGGAGGGPGGGPFSDQGRDATYYGSGGGGSADASITGGDGATGAVIIRF